MEVDVRGLRPAQIKKKLDGGELFKVAKGLYTDSAPTPERLALIAARRGYVLGGDSAVEAFLGKPLTLPLRLVGRGSLPKSPYWRFSRRKRLITLTVKGMRLVTPLLAVADAESETLALQALETRYAGVEGRRLARKDLALVTRLPQRSRELLALAAIGSDSVPERAVVRALKRRGLKVKTNVPIGPYLWDIVLPDLKVAVEINGFRFHQVRWAVIRDHWKNNDAVLRGWLTLRYTGSCVKYHADDVVEQIASARAPRLLERWHAKLVGRWHQAMISDPAYRGVEFD